MRLTARSSEKGAAVSETFEWFLGIDWGSRRTSSACWMPLIRGTRTVAHDSGARRAPFAAALEKCQCGLHTSSALAAAITAAGAKDDQRDRRRCDGLRTDRRAFRPVDDPLNSAKSHAWLQEDERRLANRLRNQLYRVDAAWLTFSPAADERGCGQSWRRRPTRPRGRSWRGGAQTLRPTARRVSADAI